MEKEVLENWLIERIAEEIEPRMIDAENPLYNYLMNGFQSFGVVTDLEAKLGRKLSPSILYEQPTISALARCLTAEKQKTSGMFDKLSPKRVYHKISKSRRKRHGI